MIKRKPMEIPPAAALRFLADMRAFHSTDDAISATRSRPASFTPSASTCPATES